MSIYQKLAAEMLEGGYDSRGIGGPTPRTSYSERALLAKKDQGKYPEVSVEKKLYRYMSASRPGELEGVRVYGASIREGDARQRIEDNLRTTKLQKLLLSGQDTGMDKKESRSFGPYYMPASDVVSSPWKSPGATMHELGHAIDYNGSIFMGDKVPTGANQAGNRRLRAALRAGYGILPFSTIPKEFAAWNKGRDALIDGAARTGAKFKDIQPILESAADAKGPALGSYIGATAGGLTGAAAGLGAGYAMRAAGASPNVSVYAGLRLALVGSVLGGITGTFTGMAAGRGTRNWAKRRVIEKHQKKFDQLSAYYRNQENKKKEMEQPMPKAAGLARKLASRLQGASLNGGQSQLGDSRGFKGSSNLAPITAPRQFGQDRNGTPSGSQGGTGVYQRPTQGSYQRPTPASSRPIRSVKAISSTRTPGGGMLPAMGPDNWKDSPYATKGPAPTRPVAAATSSPVARPVTPVIPPAPSSTSPQPIVSPTQDREPRLIASISPTPKASPVSSPTPIDKARRGANMPSSVSSRTPQPANTDVDFESEFKRYHGTSYNPQRGGRDEGLMRQMKDIYSENGKLSPSLVYNKQYGTTAKSTPQQLSSPQGTKPNPPNVTSASNPNFRSQGVNVDSPEGRALAAGFEPQPSSNPNFPSSYSMGSGEQIDINTAYDPYPASRIADSPFPGPIGTNSPNNNSIPRDRRRETPMQAPSQVFQQPPGISQNNPTKSLSSSATVNLDPNLNLPNGKVNTSSLLGRPRIGGVPPEQQVASSPSQPPYLTSPEGFIEGRGNPNF